MFSSFNTLLLKVMRVCAGGGGWEVGGGIIESIPASIR